MTPLFSGVWPTMITPFTDDNKIDFKAVEKITQWYVNAGASGIFAVCQSSEMFFLEDQEKIDLARAVVNSACGKIPVTASGHTSSDTSKATDLFGRISETGVDAVILVSNRLAEENEGEDKLLCNFNKIRRQLPGVSMGMYECPYPYLRLLSTNFIKECAEKGELVSLKDVCCSNIILRERMEAARGTKFSILNANTATLFDFLKNGGQGYNGVMGNYHIDLYRWLYDHFDDENEKCQELADFLTLAGVMEARAYPISAKYHFSLMEIAMGLHSRTKDKNIFNENARLETESLFRMENNWRKKLKIKGVSGLVNDSGINVE
jgi:4-hydroxy-tetrahydrodipicolinate synthase